MMRPLALRDMPLLNRYRNRGLFLDSTPTLTWGRAIVPAGAMLSTFSSLTGVFTSIIESQDEEPLIGQVVHNQGSTFAHFTFLAPIEKLESQALTELLNQLITRVGARGAHSIIAEVDEAGPAFAALRKAGFSIYARQRIWRVNKPGSKKRPDGQWRAAEAKDSMAVNLLCGSVVPGLVQQVEPTPWDGLSGMVMYEKGELRAYVDVRRGPRGIWMQPFVHLAAHSFEQRFVEVIDLLNPRRKRPVYICQRSYQDGLIAKLKSITAEPGPSQAVMVKRTAKMLEIKDRQAIIEGERRRAEPSTPMRVPLQQTALDLELKHYD